MIACIVILFLLQTELLCNETNLHLYFCVFQRELVLVTSHVNAFLELLHISEAAAGKLSSSYMSSSTVLSKVMLPFLYFTSMISVRVLDRKASGF